METIIGCSTCGPQLCGAGMTAGAVPRPTCGTGPHGQLTCPDTVCWCPLSSASASEMLRSVGLSGLPESRVDVDRHPWPARRKLPQSAPKELPKVCKRRPSPELFE